MHIGHTHESSSESIGEKFSQAGPISTKLFSNKCFRTRLRSEAEFPSSVHVGTVVWAETAEAFPPAPWALPESSLQLLEQNWEQEPEYGRCELFAGPQRKRHATLSNYQNLWWKWPIKPRCSSHCRHPRFFLSVDLLMLCQKAETQLWHKKLLFTVDGKLTLDWATWTPSPNINRIYQHCLNH